MEPFTPAEDKIIQNHIPTLRKLSSLFLEVYESPVTDIQKQIVFLIAILDDAETNIDGVKQMLEDKLASL